MSVLQGRLQAGESLSSTAGEETGALSQLLPDFLHIGARYTWNNDILKTTHALLSRQVHFHGIVRKQRSVKKNSILGTACPLGLEAAKVLP
jgi:hypothetical protein